MFQHDSFTENLLVKIKKIEFYFELFILVSRNNH